MCAHGGWLCHVYVLCSAEGVNKKSEQRGRGEGGVRQWVSLKRGLLFRQRKSFRGAELFYVAVVHVRENSSLTALCARRSGSLGEFGSCAPTETSGGGSD